MQAFLVQKGQSSLELRYFITVIPFTYLAAFYALGAVRRWWTRMVLALPILVVLLLGNGYTYMTAADPRYGDDVSQESKILATLQGHGPQPTSLLDYGKNVADTVQAIDRDHSLVLIDSLCGHNIWIQAADPLMYVITSDRDFQAAVNEPTRHHIKYFLVPEPKQFCRSDRINTAHPGFWQNGQGFGELVTDLGGPDRWKLYQIIAPSGF
jgi:hypothetical protein